MQAVSVRYIVKDIRAAERFYCDNLGFELQMDAAPGFAMLSKAGVRLFLNAPGAGGAGGATPDGASPAPGGWNRIQLEVDDLEREVARLRNAGAEFRNEIVEGRGGKQILLQDPSGNLVELFEAKRH
jgi:catechol 2,3-dioxygenase-like lactoylglutathione lyase family enzyme